MNTPTTTQRPSRPNKSVIAAGLAAMAALATPIYTSWEGTKLRAYTDIVGVLTICSGDTRNVTKGMVETPEGCARRTAKILEEYGLSVAEASPEVVNHPHIWASFTIFTANVGKAGYARSSVRRLYDAKQYRQACRALRKFQFAGGRRVQGLVNRREGTEQLIGEYELCLADAVRLEMGSFR